MILGCARGHNEPAGRSGIPEACGSCGGPFIEGLLESRQEMGFAKAFEEYTSTKIRLEVMGESLQKS